MRHPLRFEGVIPERFQVKACADVGADLVRITVQGMQEAKACAKIRERLFQDGCVAERRC